jgi:hypothetical protein
VIYTPLQPSVYSLGGIALALGMIVVAKFYSKIMTVDYFYKISLLVELVVLFLLVYFLVFSYNYLSALIVYTGYQLTFTFGSYLIRAETLFLSRSSILSMLDIAKQKGYLFGMVLSYVFYTILEKVYSISDKQDQVYLLHFGLLLVEIFTLFYLLKSFKSKESVQ